MDFEVKVLPPFDPDDLAGKKFLSEDVVISFVDGRRVQIAAFEVFVDALYLPTGTPYLVEFKGRAKTGGSVSGKIHIGYATIDAGGTYAISLTFDQAPAKPLTYPCDLV